MLNPLVKGIVRYKDLPPSQTHQLSKPSEGDLRLLRKDLKYFHPNRCRCIQMREFQASLASVEYPLQSE